MRHFIIHLVIMFAGALNAHCQYKELKVGDTIPEIVFNMLNGSKATKDIKEYRGKLLIIDCWNIYCAPCIKALPEYEMLQNKYFNQLQILALEGSTEKNKVSQFLKDRETTGKKINLPVAYAGTKNEGNIFFEMFPILNYGFPVELWVDAKGVLIGITSAALVNEKIIQQVLEGNLNVLITKHFQRDFDRESPLLVANNGGADSVFLFRSMITPFIDSIAGGNDLFFQRTPKMTRIFCANRTVAELAKIAIYKSPSDDLYNRLLELNVQNPSLFLRPSTKNDFQGKMAKQAYCYELILPPSFTEEEAFELMRQDMERYFNIEINVQLQKRLCLKMEVLEPGKLITKGLPPEYQLEESEYGVTLTMRNKEVDVLFAGLNRRTYPLLIDKPTLSYNVDAELRIPKTYKYEILKKELVKLGIGISEAYSMQPVILISEKKGRFTNWNLP